MSALSQAALAVTLAMLLDALCGEPPNALHPVVWMGRTIAPLKRMRPRAPHVDVALGAVYVLAVTLGFSGAAWLADAALAPWPALQLLYQGVLLFGCFALRGLVQAGEGVRQALCAGDLEAARAGLGNLCSRDPSALAPHEVAGAAIESLTENTSDSVVAPLFYFALFGVPGAVFYRAANTLDAMVGYHGRYEYLGKAAARLDDLLNLLPARLTALLLAVSGALFGLPIARGASVWRRDRLRPESPNAGHPMAMAAGLLGVRLDKRGAYVLGAELNAPDAASLGVAQRLVRATGWLAASVLIAVLQFFGRRHGLPS